MARKELMENESVKFDVRIADRLLREGKISRKDYEAYLKSLPDEESRGEYVEVFEEESDVPTPAAEDLTFTSG
jgi:hypothetical protein